LFLVGRRDLVIAIVVTVPGEVLLLRLDRERVPPIQEGDPGRNVFHHKTPASIVTGNGTTVQTLVPLRIGLLASAFRSFSQSAPAKFQITEANEVREIDLRTEYQHGVLDPAATDSHHGHAVACAGHCFGPAL
jgi:hypothetical protein